MEINECNRTLIATLGKSKRLLVVLVKWRYPFFTRMENLHKPTDVAFLGCFAEQIRTKIPEEIRSHFEHIFWFKADYTNFSNVYIDSNTIEISALSELVQDLVNLVDKSKLRLLETEEFLIDTLCKERVMHGIPGPTYADLHGLRDKSLVKQIATENRIPTASFAIVDFDILRDSRNIVDAEIARIESSIGRYPMHRKPISGCGSGGGGKLANRNDLSRWLESELERNTDGKYLVEENLQGIEFWANVCLLSDGTWKPLSIIYDLHGKTSHHYLITGQPMPIMCERFEAVRDAFPQIEIFVDRVITAFRPPHPHLFCVQGFQLSTSSSDYRLTELGYRTSGARGCGISYIASGVSQETALLACHSDPTFDASPDPKWSYIPYATLWYPKTRGKLEEHNQPPGTPEISSKIEVFWLELPGAQFEAATSYADFLVYLAGKIGKDANKCASQNVQSNAIKLSKGLESKEEMALGIDAIAEELIAFGRYSEAQIVK